MRTSFANAVTTGKRGGGGGGAAARKPPSAGAASAKGKKGGNTEEESKLKVARRNAKTYISLFKELLESPPDSARPLQEHRDAFLSELESVQQRLSSIAGHARITLLNLDSRAGSVEQRLRDALRSCFDRMLNGSSGATTELQRCVEDGQPLQHHIDLQEAAIEMHRVLVPSSAPLPTPDQPPPPLVGEFRFDQLQNLVKKLRAISTTPTSVPADAVVRTVLQISTTAPDDLPPKWASLDRSQLLQALALYDTQRTGVINVCSFLLSLIFPSDYPSTQDLRQMVQECSQHGEGPDGGLISWQSFQRVTLWFESGNEVYPSSSAQLKQLLFDIFADSRSGYLSWSNMVLSLCEDNSPSVGLRRAISLLSESSNDSLSARQWHSVLHKNPKAFQESPNVEPTIEDVCVVFEECGVHPQDTLSLAEFCVSLLGSEIFEECKLYKRVGMFCV